jgi:hypothetical protein
MRLRVYMRNNKHRNAAKKIRHNKKIILQLEISMIIGLLLFKWQTNTFKRIPINWEKEQL